MQGKKKADAGEQILDLEQFDTSWLTSELDGTADRPPRPRKRSKVAKSALWKTPTGWRLRYASHKVDGRWIRPTVLLGSFPDRAAAEAEAVRFLDARRRKEPAAGTSPAWPEYSAAYVSECLPRMRPESQATTRSVISRHIDAQFENCRLHEVGARIQQWIDAMHRENVPLSSIQHRVAVLRAMLSDAASRGLAVFLPPRLKWPKSRRVRRSHTDLTFSASEQLKVLNTARWPLKAALALGFYAGLRPSETVGLTWSLCDLKHRRLTITQQRARGGDVALPKTPTSEAVFEIVPELAEVLERYYLHQRKSDFASAPDFLFPGRNGRAMSAATLRVRHLYPMLEGLDLPRRGLHACRRAFADRMLESGATIREIQEALRHSSLRTTERYLARAQRADVAAAIRRAAKVGAGIDEIAERAI